MKSKKNSATVLAVLVLISLITLVSANPATSDSALESNDPVSVVRGFIAGDATWGSYRNHLCSRWQGIMSSSLASALDSGKAAESNGTTRAQPTVELISSGESSAVVEYVVHDSRKNPKEHSDRAYLVKEDGRWVLDNPFGIEPEWAMTGDQKTLHQLISAEVNEIETALRSSDTQALASLVENLDIKSRAEVDVSFLASAISKRPPAAILSPICVAVGRVNESSSGSYLKASYAYIGEMKTRDGTRVVRMLRGSRVFVKDRGDWKLSMTGAISGSELVSRFLQLWMQGKTDLMGYLLVPNARVDLSGTAGVPWQSAASGLPAVKAVGAVLPAPSSPLAEGDSDGNCYSVQVTFGGNNGKWQSGNYKFLIGRADDLGERYQRIASIQYCGDGKEGASH